MPVTTPYHTSAKQGALLHVWTCYSEILHKKYRETQEHCKMAVLKKKRQTYTIMYVRHATRSYDAIHGGMQIMVGYHRQRTSHLRCLVVTSICAASTGSSGPPSSQNGPILTHGAFAVPLPPGRRGGFSRSFGDMPLPNARRIPLRILARPSLEHHKKKANDAVWVVLERV